jgi:hypothetical protein
VNAAVAIGIVECLEEAGFAVSTHAIRAGIGSVEWPGRMQVLRERPLLLVDSAHDPASIDALLAAIERHFPDRRRHYIVGFFRDKDWPQMLRQLAPTAASLLLTSNATPRAVPPETLAEEVRTLDVPYTTAPSMAEALQQAREQKMVRFVGITGHSDPDVLLEGIRRFPFDTILMAVNAADKHHLSFTEKLLPVAVEKQMGIIGMKIPARGRILAGWTPPAPGATRPREGGATAGTLSMREAMYYVLSLPVSTVIVGCDSPEQVEENVKLARELSRRSTGRSSSAAWRAGAGAGAATGAGAGAGAGGSASAWAGALLNSIRAISETSRV